ncbi:MAG: hypothetical protein N2V74_07400 [Candidatus Methanospirare jalkutatii]|nr:MAG: hypothetical protein N2V74_07400 [Candidatus Methanospirare jalkutatii]
MRSEKKEGQKKGDRRKRFERLPIFLFIFDLLARSGWGWSKLVV